MLKGASLACLLISIKTYHASMIRKKFVYIHLQGSTLGDLTIDKLLWLKMAAIMFWLYFCIKRFIVCHPLQMCLA